MRASSPPVSSAIRVPGVTAMSRTRLLLPLLALGLLAAPAAAAQAIVPGYVPPDGRASIRVFRSESFKEANAAISGWRVAWKSRDVRATAGRYTDDATLQLPNGALLHGRDQIERVLAGLLPRAGAFEMGAADFGVCETMAFLVGRFFYEGGPGSGPVAGTHVTIFRLERDRWMIRSQVFRPDPPAATAAAPAPGGGGGEEAGAAEDPASPAAGALDC